MAAETKIVLEEREIPTHWYNVVPDLASPPPPVLHPGTGQPIGPSDLAPLFPMAVIMQEVSAEPRIEIPDQVRDIWLRSLRSRRLHRCQGSCAQTRLTAKRSASWPKTVSMR